jgi:hydroxyacylglutathione hydrolase
MKKVEIIPLKCGLANVFILVGQKVVIVDSGLKGSTEKILKQLEQSQLNRSDVSLIVLTHAHPDHCLNIKHLSETLQAPVAINAKEAHYLEIGEFAPVIPLNLNGKLLFRLLRSIHEKHSEVIKPAIQFENELDLVPYGVAAKVVSTPGHSYGASSIAFHDGRWIVGDLFIESAVLHKPELPPFAVDLAMLKASLRNILDGNATEIHSSHGRAWGKDELKAVLASKIQ